MDISGNIIALIVMYLAVSIQGTLMEQNLKITPPAADTLEQSTVIFNCTSKGNTTWINWKDQLNICIFLRNCTEVYNITRERLTCKCSNTLKNEITITLQIRNIKKTDHNSSWTCSVSSLPVITKHAMLFVKVPVKKIAIIPAEKVVQVSENTSYEFTCCTSQSRPPPSVLWRVAEQKDHQNIQYFTGNQSVNTSKIGLTSVTSRFNYSPNRSVNGWVIYCVVETTHIQKHEVTSAPIRLDVTYPPESKLKINGSSHEIIYKIIEKKNTQLTCTIEGGNPQPLIIWECYNSGENTSFTNKGLAKQVIWLAERKTDRNCTCYSKQKERNETLTVGVEILYPPGVPNLTIDLFNVSGNASVVLNRSLSLNCDSDSKPVSSYKWMINNITVNSLKTLQINTIRKEDQGQYTCLAENTMFPTGQTAQNGKNKATLGIKVLYPPTIEPMGDQIINVGLPFNISCPVLRGNPINTQFMWTTNGTDRLSLNQNFEIPNVSKSDDMVYTCTVNNTMTPTVGDPVEGRSSEDFHLNVEYYATVVDFFVEKYPRESNVTVHEMDNVRFICNVDSNPVSTTDIKKQSEVVLVVRETNILRYTLSHVTCLDTGEYVCMGNNKHNIVHISGRHLFLFVY